jgi:hypothetical protein
MTRMVLRSVLSFSRSAAKRAFLRSKKRPPRPKFMSKSEIFAPYFAGGPTAQAPARGPARSVGIAVGRMQSWDR